MPHRRQVLQAVALSPVAAAASTALPLARAHAEAAIDPGAVSEPAPPFVDVPVRGAPIPEIAPGPIGDLSLAGGFRVVSSRAVHEGALSFVVEGEGQRFQLDVLRRDPAVEGAYDTEALSVFVFGGATVLTAATHVRGARALGAALTRRIEAGATLPLLSTFSEREAAHPRGARTLPA